MRKVIIMRGLPGSGKSTLAQKLLTDHIAEGGKVGLCAIYATDDYFIHDGEYKFDGRQLSKAHQWNQSRFLRALDNNYSCVIVDNTHTQFWEMIKYLELAADNGYEVFIAESNTNWAKDVDKLLEMNTHGVPREAIQRMLDRWDETDDIIEQYKEKSGLDIKKVIQ